jgi:methylmalonyl-CoA mutase N-terminal domain/subunit
VDSGERIIVGVNDYVTDEASATPILKMDPRGYARQVARLSRVRAERDGAVVQASLRDLTDAARDGRTNLMYPILDAVNACATLGEITGVFRQVFGEYQEPVFF